MRLRVIVNDLPPATSGVGDYALALARQMRAAAGVETEFYVGNPARRGSTRVDGFPVEVLGSRSVRSLRESLADSTDPVFVHYVGYGYHNRGVPFWLVSSLAREARRGVRLTTFFHEIEGSGGIASSSFWLRPLMRYLWVRMARHSVGTYCSSEIVERYLRRHGGANPVRLAVFSTVGERLELPPATGRQRRLVVFGGRAFREASYTTHLADLERTVAALRIEEIVDIGPALSALPAHVGNVAVNPRGRLEADEIGAIMTTSLAGFVPYPLFVAAKSTIVAAYCAHGLAPVLHAQPAHASDGIVPGETVLLADAGLASVDDARLARVAAAAHAWYCGHSLARTAQLMADSIRAAAG